MMARRLHYDKGATRPSGGAGAKVEGGYPTGRGSGVWGLKFMHLKYRARGASPGQLKNWRAYRWTWGPINRRKAKKDLRIAMCDERNTAITARIDADATPIEELKARLKREGK